MQIICIGWQGIWKEQKILLEKYKLAFITQSHLEKAITIFKISIEET